MIVRSIVLVTTTICLVACSTTAYQVTQPTMRMRHSHTHMDLSVRDTIDKVVVVPHTDTAEQIIFGTYGAPQPSPTVTGIYNARLPIEIAWAHVISEFPFGLPAEIVIPYLVLPFVLYGAAKQGIQNQIQEMRDAMADYLTESAGRPVSNMVLAHDLYAEMRTVPGLDANVITETTPLPEDTDAVLLVKLTEIVIEVVEDEADIKTSASAILRRVSDGKTLYSRQYFYSDRDTLRNWTANDVALWQDYMNFARHYVAREITADFFEKIELRHDLYPIATDSVTPVRDNNWQARAATGTPTLAWKYVRLGEDTYAPRQVAFGEADTFYDLEVYDRHRLVYVARHIPDPRHVVEQPLPTCRELRWTVRPSFHVAGDVKYGEWMRFYSTVYLNEGYVGTEASELPAFLRGFAVLQTPCEKT